MSFVVFTACATPYQKREIRGGYGYEDVHIKDNIYYVNVQVNGFTGMDTAREYFNRRAKEVCLENGYQDYQISQGKDTSTAPIIVDSGGTLPPQPRIAGYVECLVEKKPGTQGSAIKSEKGLFKN